MAKELQYWADQLDNEYGPAKIKYKRYQSLSGDWYNIPDDENYSAQVSGYTYAVLISDESMMLWYESGKTGWVPIND